MKTIEIGRNGNQPFKITAAGVSARHAMLTITDSGDWILQDLNSSNGTFIRNANYNFDRISKCRITKDTVIRLGNESANGVTFMAMQLVKRDQNDYSEEFMALKKDWMSFSQDSLRIDRRIDRVAFITPVLMVLLSVLIPNSVSFVLQKGMMVAATLPAIFLQMRLRERKRDIAEKSDGLFVCPKCGKRLSSFEIKHEQCSSCKAHG